jgi:hypothetical protein
VAARLLREALAKEPSSLQLHYYLAIAATHLGLRDEAVREFKWVVANAAADSAEAQAARQWLTDAGELATVATATTASTPAEPTTEAGSAIIRGRVSWPEGEPPVPIARVQIFLKGLKNTPTADQYKVLRTENDGSFEFKNVMPGTYKVTNRIAGLPTWRLRVEVVAGEPVTLELTPQNSTRSRDDFPNDN